MKDECYSQMLFYFVYGSKQSDSLEDEYYKVKRGTRPNLSDRFGFRLGCSRVLFFFFFTRQMAPVLERECRLSLHIAAILSAVSKKTKEMAYFFVPLQCPFCKLCLCFAVMSKYIGVLLAEYYMDYSSYLIN